MEKDEVILVKGNHEDCFCDLVTVDNGKALHHHLHNGTYQTALDLTGFDLAMAYIRRYDFAEAGRQTSYYTQIIPSMLDYYETEHYIFVHGWIPCYKLKDGSFKKLSDWRNRGRGS